MLIKFETPDGPIWIAPDRIEMVTFPALDFERVSEDRYVEFHIAGCCVVKRLGDQEFVIGTPDEIVAKINAAMSPPARKIKVYLRKVGDLVQWSTDRVIWGWETSPHVVTADVEWVEDGQET